jgi:hypothetical protein
MQEFLGEEKRRITWWIPTQLEDQDYADDICVLTHQKAINQLY